MVGATPAPRPRGRRPGGVDVARVAGVSQKTVYRVFNNERHVSEDIRRRVLAAAQDLGYRPNGAARALNTGRTRRVGVAATGTAHFGPSSLLVALEREARRLGYSLSIANSFGEDPDGVTGAIGTLMEQHVDAIILSEPIDLDEGPLVVDVPVLTLGRAPRVEAPVVLSVDAAEGGRAAAEATRHLLRLGHATVHHVAGPQRWWSARERMEHWRGALSAHGAAVPAYLEGDWTPGSGYELGKALARDPGVTAVFAANDEMAIGVVHALTEAGRPVPGEISVVGFDDIPVAAHLTPPLTTISSDNSVLASAGLRYLLAYLDDPDSPPPRPPEHEHRLVVRESTAQPPRSLRPARGGAEPSRIPNRGA
jgi:DNA-binding LacI/PurR family transcriptional regulator